MTNDRAVPRSHANQRSSTPMTTVATQTSTPARSDTGHRRTSGDSSQPTASPIRNGAATPSTDSDAVALVVGAPAEDDEQEHGRDVERQRDRAAGFTARRPRAVTTAL